jgi:hypothetical protein
MERRSRKKFSSAGSEKKERVGDRTKWRDSVEIPTRCSFVI